MNFLDLDATASTNTYVAENSPRLRNLTMVTARRQSAGRGQRGNVWESEPGKNLTFSILYRPISFPAIRQFSISEAVALGITDALASFGIEAEVKWPNDIYVGNKKICGILIEHSIMGREIMHSIAGAGLNVNQEQFLSDAPNPVSMCILLGCHLSLHDVKERVAVAIESRLTQDFTRLHTDFMHRLWRGDGEFHPYKDTATGETFEARIEAVEPTGILQLTDRNGSLRKYAFKEVSFIL